ncbi:MAG: Holliday junction resolvase RuvX [Nitrospirota bacterium]|nr:Holliday junction resolvase RuvX [Nitrospirota bacterium]
MTHAPASGPPDAPGGVARTHARVLALDVGDRTIGVAVSDTLGIAAHPVETIRRRSEKADLERVRQLADERQVERVLVGLPRMLDGSLGVQAEKVREFAQHLTRYLAETLPLPVELWDERYSTAAAESALIESGLTRKRRKQVVDQVAAVYFLQGYLEFLRLHPEGRGEPVPEPVSEVMPKTETSS